MRVSRNTNHCNSAGIDRIARYCLWIICTLSYWHCCFGLAIFWLTLSWEPGLAQEDSTVQRAPEAKSQTRHDVVPLMHDYDAAIETAEDCDRPLLVILGAQWCAPCKLLEKELEQSQSDPILTNWIVVKVDIDEEPGLAREWEVNAVPAFRILDQEQGVLASNEGYGGLPKLREWLNDQYDSVHPRTLRLFKTEQSATPEIAGELIALLKSRKATHRKLAVDRLAKSRTLVAPALFEDFQSGNLSQRICIQEILDRWQIPSLGIDPWDPESFTEERLKKLRALLELDKAAASEATEPVNPESDQQ